VLRDELSSDWESGVTRTSTGLTRPQTRCASHRPPPRPPGASSTRPGPSKPRAPPDLTTEVAARVWGRDRHDHRHQRPARSPSRVGTKANQRGGPPRSRPAPSKQGARRGRHPGRHPAEEGIMPLLPPVLQSLQPVGGIRTGPQLSPSSAERCVNPLPKELAREPRLVHASHVPSRAQVSDWRWPGRGF
jgi:hypothetical protein